MKNKLVPHMHIHPDVTQALKLNLPVVALESTVITHGLPKPTNLNLALSMENIIRNLGATPATIAMLNGSFHIGLTGTELVALADASDTIKISRRDISPAIAQKRTGGTTVSGTMVAANQAGIRVFATGGIGGVHRVNAQDISPDLEELAQTPMIVVCAGAKAILDLPATLEYLETMGVPVIGYQTNEFPAFYSRSSGLKIPFKVDSPEELAEIALIQWEYRLKSAILVVQPVPVDAEIPRVMIEPIIREALDDARMQGISGSSVTPFLLSRVSQLSDHTTLKTNLALLENNAILAARIAIAISKRNGYLVV